MEIEQVAEKALSRYIFNDPMKLIIVIVLGTLTFQGASFQSRSREQGVMSRYESNKRSMLFFYTQAKRSKIRQRRVRVTRSGQRFSNYKMVRIYNRHTRYFLQISKDGRVNGTTEPTSENVKFRMEVYGNDLVRLYNEAQKRYVAINHKGCVISQGNFTDESLFKVTIERKKDDEWFHSAVYPKDVKNNREKWFLTLKKSGKIKNAKRTDQKMKATKLFLMDPV